MTKASLRISKLFATTAFQGVILGAWVGTIFGCSSAQTKAMPLGEKRFDAKPEGCSIQVLTGSRQNKKYAEVCWVSARSTPTVFADPSAARLLPAMKAKACGCGADAIVLRSAKDGARTFAGPRESAEATATAIRFVN